MKKLMFLLLIIFGALSLGAQDNIHIIRESEINDETEITIPVPDSIWDSVFIFKDGATATQNYYVWRDKKPRDLKYEDSLIKYVGFNRTTIETTKILLSDSVSGKNVVVPKKRPETSNFAYEIIFIFVISTIIILILQSIKNKGKNSEQMEYVICVLVVLVTIPFFTTEIGVGIRTVLLYTAIPLFSLVINFISLKKGTKLITAFYFLMNLLSSIIIIFLFPKIMPLLIANIAGLVFGVTIICVHKIIKKNEVGEVYVENNSILQ